MKLAVMLPNWVGDACMATPALRSLRRELGTATKIYWIGRPGPLGVLEGLYADGPEADGPEVGGEEAEKVQAPWADGILRYKPRSGGGKVLNRRGLVRAMRREKFDAIVYLTNSLSTALLGVLAGIPKRVGYARDGRSLLLTERVAVRGESHDARQDPCIDNYLRLVRQLGCSGTDRRTELHVSSEDRRLATACLEELGFSQERPLVVLNAGAATTATKRWPVEQASKAARQLTEELGCNVLVHCGPSERDVAAQIEEGSRSEFVRSMGRVAALPLGLSRGVIARSRLVVSTDSGPRHIGVALNKPVVSLFGSIDPKHTQSANVPETLVTLGLACQPCGSYKCRYKHSECMSRLDAERVVRAAKRVWGELAGLPIVVE